MVESVGNSVEGSVMGLVGIDVLGSVARILVNIGGGSVEAIPKPKSFARKLNSAVMFEMGVPF